MWYAKESTDSSLAGAKDRWRVLRNTGIIEWVQYRQLWKPKLFEWPCVFTDLFSLPIPSSRRGKPLWKQVGTLAVSLCKFEQKAKPPRTSVFRRSYKTMYVKTSHKLEKDKHADFFYLYLFYRVWISTLDTCIYPLLDDVPYEHRAWSEAHSCPLSHLRQDLESRCSWTY